VYAHDETSENFRFPCGVPQGSILGPLLFSLYVNDLQHALSNLPSVDVIQYADDTSLIITCSRDISMESTVSAVLQRLMQWFESNMLALNLGKTKFVYFGAASNSHQIEVCQTVVSNVQSARFLGLIVDSRLTWESHIQRIVGKLRYLGKFLLKLRHLLTTDMAMTLVKVLAMPVVDLFDVIYGMASTSALHTLDVAFNDLLRIVLRVSKTMHVSLDFLYSTASLDRLVERRIHSLKRTIIRLYNKSLFCNCRNLWRERTYHYDSRNRARFEIHRPRTKFGVSMLSYRGLKLLNQVLSLSV
jgi:Reverse transcriptase (RNA-dependent DNA polymerase)